MSKKGLGELIEALQIFSKYTDKSYCYGAEHDEFYVWVEPELVSDEDKVRLEEIGFIPEDGNGFMIFT